MIEKAQNTLIQTNQLKVHLGGRWVLDGIDLTIKHGEIFAIVGGSGSGKTTLLRTLLLLQAFHAGSINFFGKEIFNHNPADASMIRSHSGVLFQSGALFSSLTLLENVAFPLRKLTQLPPDIITHIALLKISLSGLEIESATKYPAELSGGMQKRAALARAIALDPELLFLDEPTAGLDPESASALDELLLNLRETLGLTVIVVTHDLDTLWRVADRVAFLGNGTITEIGTMEQLSNSRNPLVRAYFQGSRGKKR